MKFITDNKLLLIIFLVVIVMTTIGYFVDKYVINKKEVDKSVNKNGQKNK